MIDSEKFRAEGKRDSGPRIVVRSFKAAIRDALIKGRHLRQERTAHVNEIGAVDELIAEGSAKATDWREDGVRVVRRASHAFDE
jgi:hypothetical protein